MVDEWLLLLWQRPFPNRTESLDKSPLPKEKAKALTLAHEVEQRGFEPMTS
jgi:hypothetical protein